MVKVVLFSYPNGVASSQGDSTFVPVSNTGSTARGVAKNGGPGAGFRGGTFFRTKNR